MSDVSFSVPRAVKVAIT
ncbi:hypothetical protein P3L04_03165, partial [Treponema pallidum]